MFSEPVVRLNNKGDKKLQINNILPKKEVNFDKSLYYKNKLLYSQGEYNILLTSINGHQEDCCCNNLLRKRYSSPTFRHFLYNPRKETNNYSYSCNISLFGNTYNKVKFNDLPVNYFNRWNEINQNKRRSQRIMVHNTYIEVERPLNLMNDPRVFRGSVIAKQREYQKLRREAEERRLEEIKYKTNILRSKLEQSFKEQNIYSQNLNGIDSYKKDDHLSQYTGLNASKNLPKVNGPLGATRRFFDVNEKIPYNKINTEKLYKQNEYLPPESIDNKTFRRSKKSETTSKKAKLLPLRREMANRSLSAEYGKIQQLRKENFALNKYNHNFSNVKFVPVQPDRKLHKDNNSNQDILTKVIPTLAGNGNVNGEVYHSHKYRRKLMNINEVPNNSLSTPPSYVDTEVQTYEDDEEYLISLAHELSFSAISTSIYNLKSEEEIEKLKKDKIIITNNLMKKDTKLEDLERLIQEKENTEENLLRQRDKMEELIKLLESRKMAYFTVNDVIDSSITNLLEKDLIKEVPRYKSIANDTNDLEKQKKNYKLVITEIKYDFMPWIIKRVEKVVFQMKAEKELRHALFSEHFVVRNEAKKALREFIKDAEKLHYKPYKF